MNPQTPDDLTQEDVDLVREEMDGAPQPENWNGPADSPHEASLTKVLARVIRQRADLTRIRDAALALSRAVEPADLPPDARVALLRLRALLAAGGADPVRDHE